MEFFVCQCRVTAHVLFDGNDQGLNKDASGNLRTIQSNAGLQSVSLKRDAGKACMPGKVAVVIENTDPSRRRRSPRLPIAL
jgi:hypothetical protein